MNIDTQLIHGGNQVENNGSIIPAIYLSTTFKQTEAGVCDHEYIRCSNPTRNKLEKCIAVCENWRILC